MSKLTLEQVDNLIESYKDSNIYKYYHKYGEGKASGYAKQKLYAKTPHGKQTLLKTLANASEKRNSSVKKWLSTLTSEQRSEWSKQGWNKEEGYEERREHISNLGNERAEANSQRLRDMNQDSERQSNRGKKGGPKGGKVMGNKVSYCQYCKETYKGVAYNRYHGEKCKENPNRVIHYNYELVKDGKSFGQFEEKGDIANHLQCSAALISRYMSGSKKNIKGYQIITIS